VEEVMDLENKTIPEVKGYELIDTEEFYNSEPQECIRLFFYHGRFCTQYFYKEDQTTKK